MCGLVGYIGKHGIKLESVFKNMLRIDVIRGPHSTGVGMASSNGAWDLVKLPVLPDDLLDNPKWKRASSLYYECYIGHNRYATVGKVNSSNAHPFIHGEILGCHNGTIRNKYKYDSERDFDTDSETLIFNIDKHGIDKVWGMLEGAAALVFYNLKEGSLNFIRNKERPLFYSQLKDDSGLFWASEPWIIEAMLRREDLKHGPIYSLNENKLLTIQYDKVTNKISKSGRMVKEFVPPPPVVYKPYNPPYTYGGSQNNNAPFSQGTVRSIGSGSKNLQLPLDGKELKGSFTPISHTAVYNTKTQEVVRHKFSCTGDGLQLTVSTASDDPYLLLEHFETFNIVRFNGKYSITLLADGRQYLFMTDKDIDIVVPQYATRIVDGVALKEDEFYNRIKECGWCSSKASFKDLGAVFGKRNSMICGDCVSTFDSGRDTMTVNEAIQLLEN